MKTSGKAFTTPLPKNIALFSGPMGGAVSSSLVTVGWVEEVKGAEIDCGRRAFEIVLC